MPRSIASERASSANGRGSCCSESEEKARFPAAFAASLMELDISFEVDWVKFWDAALVDTSNCSGDDGCASAVKEKSTRGPLERSKDGDTVRI